MEAHTKREVAKKEAAAASGDVNPADEMAATIISMPMSGAGAALCMGVFVEAGASLINFPFIAECAPLVSSEFPEDWQRWRDKARADWRPFLDEMANGPLLEGDALVAACRARRGSHKPKVSSDAS
jgi:hypothetical protein